VSTPSSASPAPAQTGPAALEPHGERRRAQLIRAAAHVIEYEGLDALRMPRVAALAGCTRTLVYRYFPGREDLLRAVAAEYYAALTEGFERQTRQRVAHGEPERDDPIEQSLANVDIVFEVLTELGLAGLLVRNSPALAADMRDHLRQLSRDLGLRWSGPVLRAGVSPLHTAVASEAGAAVLVDVVQRWQRGEISRDEAQEITRTCFRALFEAFARRGAA